MAFLACEEVTLAAAEWVRISSLLPRRGRMAPAMSNLRCVILRNAEALDWWSASGEKTGTLMLTAEEKKLVEKLLGEKADGG